MTNALDLIDGLIADLEAKLNLPPGSEVESSSSSVGGKKSSKKKKKAENKPKKAQKKNTSSNNALDQPEICKLEFKVGVITKVWVHPDADKLYCEEIDVGEDTPRLIASGLRKHYSEKQMQGQRLLVVSNLKPKNLVGFKSHGMVLCAAQVQTDGSEKVEFIEPPEGAALGELVTFEGLPKPQPLSASQVEKKKIFAACMEGMKTTKDCTASWNGHAFTTSAGACKCPTIKGGVMR